MTRRLYYTDSYLSTFQAKVIALDAEALRVTLDQTAFYPTSGGQPNDLGTLNGIAVTDVIDDGAGITHILASPLIAAANAEPPPIALSAFTAEPGSQADLSSTNSAIVPELTADRGPINAPNAEPPRSALSAFTAGPSSQAALRSINSPNAEPPPRVSPEFTAEPASQADLSSTNAAIVPEFTADHGSQTKTALIMAANAEPPPIALSAFTAERGSQANLRPTHAPNAEPPRSALPSFTTEPASQADLSSTNAAIVPEFTADRGPINAPSAEHGRSALPSFTAEPASQADLSSTNAANMPKPTADRGSQTKTGSISAPNAEPPRRALPAFSELTVKGEILWHRRYDHMQQHTGQHLLSAVFARLFEIPTLSFRMGEEASTIELGTKNLTAHQLETAILRATELARANPAIQISFEDAEHAAGLRKASERTGTLRIVEMPGIDRSACGGTHVAHLSEVLPLQIRDVDKVRGNVRLSFVCGNRAIAHANHDFQLLSRLAKNLSTSLSNMEAQIGTLQKRLADAEKQRKRLELEAATRAGLDLYIATPIGPDGLRRAAISQAAIDETSRAMAKTFASQSKAVMLMHTHADALLAASPDSGLNMQQALATAGLRGGGSATMAQGGIPDATALQKLKNLLGLT